MTAVADTLQVLISAELPVLLILLLLWSLIPQTTADGSRCSRSFCVQLLMPMSATLQVLLNLFSTATDPTTVTRCSRKLLPPVGICDCFRRRSEISTPKLATQQKGVRARESRNSEPRAVSDGTVDTSSQPAWPRQSTKAR